MGMEGSSCGLFVGTILAFEETEENHENLNQDSW
jgi:hypothetical protein